MRTPQELRSRRAAAAIAMRTMVSLNPEGRLAIKNLLTRTSYIALGGFNGSLVVDMKNMASFSYNEGDHTVTFGPVSDFLTLHL